MPSCAAKPEAGRPSPERIAATTEFLAGRGIYGVVWLDPGLVAIERYGELIADITLGKPITESVLAFLGLDDELKALRDAPRRSLAIPGVKVQSRAGDQARVNLVVYWMPDEQCYVLLVARAVSRTDLEHAYLAESRMRHMAEAEVAAQAEIIRRANTELAIANGDLEEFAYVISHDLRAPLRGMRYAATDAQAAIAASDPTAAAEHVARVIERSRRMGAMLTGLLDYSRIGRKSQAAELLDTRDLAEEIATTSGEGSDIRVVVEGNWPAIRTVAEPLDIVLRNLVDNAVKHHDRDEGTIVLACRADAAALVITVADDGPGIEPEWHIAIFEPFKQIAEADAASGAGIGLALVKKTVERFGGSISVQSDPARQRGTTFRLTWPRQLAA